MKILLLNNTENYHAGSKQVITFLKNEFRNHQLITPKTLKNIVVEEYDLVILNGEGSMHSSNLRPKIVKWLEIMSAAAKKGIKTAIINTVWENNSIEATQMLENFFYVSVREIKSKEEILKTVDTNVDIFLDLSYYTKVNYIPMQSQYNIVTGNRYSDFETPKISNVGENGTIDIFTESWDIIVNKLRHSNILVTGRHHEMYAACKARCMFIVLEGNSHKNQGLIKTFDLNIPVLPKDASNDTIIKTIKWAFENQHCYKRLFDLMETYPIPKLANILI